ncbi:MAG: hypothetical protein M3320_03760, partial [Actinomycetota bacterium]|nr:hypothetical protein [Actinomycetota bacterium]
MATVAFLAPPAAASTVWAAEPCSQPLNLYEVRVSDQCIGGYKMRARGFIGAWCLALEAVPVPGQFYPDPAYCGGGGAEYLAQARLIRRLDSAFISVGPDTQWEVQVQFPLSGKTGRADITSQAALPPDDTAEHLEVYELKQTSNSTYMQTAAQVAGYVSALNQAGGTGVTPRARLGVNGGRIAQFVDSFVTPRPGFTPCTAANGVLVYYQRLYVSLWVAPGIIAVHHFDLPCFDPATERVPVPAKEQIPVPGETGMVDVPTERVVGGGPGGTGIGVGAGDGGGDGSGGSSSGTGATWKPAPGTTIAYPPGSTGPTSGGPNGGGGAGTPIPVVTPVPQNDSRPKRCATTFSICHVITGDPHVATIDGLGYDMQSAGEFRLIEGDELEIQGRFVPSGQYASVLDRMAFSLGRHVVEINPSSRTFLLDGAPYPLPDGFMVDFGDGSSITNEDNSLWVTWPGTGDRPGLEAGGRRVAIEIPPGTRIRGLAGNGDGDPSNDLMLSTGEQLPATASPTVIHGTFADSWRVSGDESLFTYAPGESTETFTDTAFPAGVISLGDLSDSVLAEATRVCSDASVADGRAFDDCVYDWALTRDSSFVEAAAADTSPATEPGARKMDADGRIAEDFESSSVPSNFSSARYGTGASTGRFAGAFGRDGRYSFYVPDLLGHTSATLKLDLVALGDWGSDPNPVTITVNGANGWVGELAGRTPSATGTTPAGTPYRVYPITLTVPHSEPQLQVGVSAQFPIGEARAFGVDNIEATVDAVTPQRFDVSLPASISDGAPAPGAGRLETAGSEDVYAITLADPEILQIDFNDCSTSLGVRVDWQLTDAASGATKAGGGSCSSTQTARLPAGDYRLSVWQRGETGTYRLAIQRRPDPQRFDVTLPGAVSDGSPAAGAGNLETTASEDHYAFTLASAGGLIVDVSACSTAVWRVAWKLVAVGSGATVGTSSGSLCRAIVVPNLPAGDYRLEVSANGRSGTYSLGMEVEPAPQTFAVTLPAAISPGVPDAGAGNLETAGSEDRYTFSTATAGGVQVNFSDCVNDTHSVQWRVVAAATGAVEVPDKYGCGSEIVQLPAGDHRLVVVRPGYKGTYELGLLVQPPPDTFDVALPFEASDGQPGPGAGNLETTASNDVYT